ncbi:MAG: histidinol-phosphatase HisJ family protein [Culicoidibacterales bacterium]
MKYFDTHVHSYYSPDSSTKIEALIHKAKSVGCDMLYISDHMDYLDGEKTHSYYDIDKYLAEMEQLQQAYPEIKLQKSIEIGFEKNSVERIKKTIEKYPFDSVLMSIHRTAGGSIFRTARTMETEKEALDLLEAVLDATWLGLNQFSNFDILTHFDYVVRYLPEKIWFLPHFEKKVTQILTKIIEMDKCLEINTKAYSDLGVPHPQKEILSRYFELGGKYISLGSDAHTANDFQAKFPEAIALAKSVGFEEVCYFINRKRYTQKI